jgi:hypothetical protein
MYQPLAANTGSRRQALWNKIFDWVRRNQPTNGRQSSRLEGTKEKYFSSKQNFSENMTCHNAQVVAGGQDHFNKSVRLVVLIDTVRHVQVQSSVRIVCATVDI